MKHQYQEQHKVGFCCFYQLSFLTHTPKAHIQQKKNAFVLATQCG